MPWKLPERDSQAMLFVSRMVGLDNRRVKSRLSIVVMAAMTVANVVKSSFGPVGLDKMLVDDLGVCKS